MGDELKELQKITRILTLANTKALTEALSEYASTEERKIIWVLIDGVNMPKDMVKKMLVEKMGKTEEEAEKMIADFEEKLPMVKDMCICKTCPSS